jgi:hypothetical protein
MSEESKKRAVQFWDWFQENHKQFLFINEIVDEEEKERLLDVFLEKLHIYNPELFFEMGGYPNAQTVDLIITAQGIVSQFKSVEELIDSSPKMKDWNFIAFKPPMGTTFTTQIGGRTFDPSKILFIPLESDEDPDWTGIEVCYPDYNDEDRNEFILGTYLMLDVLLGEKSTALDIDFLDVVYTPDDISEFPFFHLSEIKEFIESNKRNN